MIQERCKTSSVGQSTGLLILRSSVRFRQKLKKTENSNLHGFEVHRPSSKGTKLLLQVIKAIINQGFHKNIVISRGPKLPSFWCQNMRLKKCSSYDKKNSQSAPWRIRFFQKKKNSPIQNSIFLWAGDALERPFLFVRLKYVFWGV